MKVNFTLSLMNNFHVVSAVKCFKRKHTNIAPDLRSLDVNLVLALARLEIEDAAGFLREACKTFVCLCRFGVEKLTLEKPECLACKAFGV